MTAAPAQAELIGPPLALFSGRLVRRAEVRARVLDAEGHSVPVLCLDIESDGPTHAAIHAEQPFPFGQQNQAEAAARRLKAGTHVTVETPIAGVRLHIPHALHIHAAATEEGPST